MTGQQLTLDYSAPIGHTARLAPAPDRQRLRGQNAAILDRLRRGPATNAELASISLKYTSRLSDLRSAGFDVRSERVDGGTWIYRVVE
jgi:hypothetical protein